MATTIRDRQQVSCSAFLPRTGADEDDPTMRRQVLFNAAIEIAEILARKHCITVIDISDERGEGVEYRLRCDVLTGRQQQ